MARTMLIRDHMGEEELERVLYADVAAADAAFLAHERNLLEELPQQLSSESSSRQRALFFARVGALRDETMHFRQSLLKLCDCILSASRIKQASHHLPHDPRVRAEAGTPAQLMAVTSRMSLWHPGM